MSTTEAVARVEIDAALAAAGWAVQDRGAVNLFAAPGVAVREFPLAHGHGEADYLLFVDAQAVGAVEAKRPGVALSGVETQSAKYGDGLPATLNAPVRPLPFGYESTGVETFFTNRLDPDPRSRRLAAFHRPDALARWVAASPLPTPIPIGGGGRRAAEFSPPYDADRPATLRARLRQMPPIDARGLWPAQLTAVTNLERSLADDRPRSLIQMATGSGKTFTAITAVYRLIKFGGAHRVLFLVDRANLGRQAMKEFQAYVPPDDNRPFTDLYNVQHLQSNKLDPVAKICITTIQRLYSILRGEAEFDAGNEEGSLFEAEAALRREPVPVAYNPDVPIEWFDLLVVDECHRSIYGLWRQVLDYFDAFTIGLTATPSKQTFGYFRQNLVMEYNHQQAVADGVNVDYDIYQIRTRITETGSTVEADYIVGKRDRTTRALRWERLDEDVTYAATAIDRDVVAMDQIRTVVRTFKAKLFTEIFPGRREVPKTLIFAKDDSHADDIVRIVREEFGAGNDFCQKITYRTNMARIVETVSENGQATERVTYKSSGVKAEDLLSSFRNSYFPRIVVTVDMIATGTDVKPLEIVMFMRAVRSRNFFEQMKGRGVRVINRTDLVAVTPDAAAKDRFVLVDCVGVTEDEFTDNPSLERKRSIKLGALLEAVGFGSTDPDTLSSVAGRLARLDRQLAPDERADLITAAAGMTLGKIAGGIVAALDPDAQVAAARAEHGLAPDAEPTTAQVAAAGRRLLAEAARPLAANPDLRAAIVAAGRRAEQTIDEVSQDEVTRAGFSIDAKERAAALVESFETFLVEHRDEIAALEILYAQPHGRGLRLADVRALAKAIQTPPRAWTPEALWRAYETLDKSKVRGAAGTQLTNLVALVRFALHHDAELVPYPERVAARYDAWLAQQEVGGRRFTSEQRAWLEAIRDHVAGSLRVEMSDLDEVPFRQRGGLGKVYDLFGDELDELLEELNEVLVA